MWSYQNIFPSNNSIEIFCCIDMEYLMRQTIFKIQRILFFKSSRLPFCDMEYSMRQYSMKAVEYCQFTLFIVLFLKSLKNSITQYLLKGMEPLKYLPCKELEELLTAFLAAIAALYVAMSVGRSVGWSVCYKRVSAAIYIPVSK